MHRLDAHIPGLADAVFRQINGIPPNLNVPPSGRPAPESRRTNVDLPGAIAKQCHDLTFRHVQGWRAATPPPLRTISVSLLH